MPFERNVFRLVVAVGGLVPVCAGGLGATVGFGPLVGWPSEPLDVTLDSHLRYLSGLLLGIGLAFWATLRRPEAYGARYRLLGAIVFLGGIGRLVGLLAAGAPAPPMIFALVMELAATPAICLWQARLARRAGR